MGAVADFLTSLIYGKDGKISPAKIAGLGAAGTALYGALKPDSKVGEFLGTGSNQRPVGYSEGIPEYGVTRALLPDAFLNYPDKEVAKFVNETYGLYGGPGVAANREIAKAMNKYGVSPTQVARTTGFTPKQVEADYRAFGYGTPATQPAVVGQRRPGSGGRRYFTDMTYTPTNKTMSSAINPVTVPSQLFVPPSSPPVASSPVAANSSLEGLFGALTPADAKTMYEKLFGPSVTNVSGGTNVIGGGTNLGDGTNLGGGTNPGGDGTNVIGGGTNTEGQGISNLGDDTEGKLAQGGLASLPQSRGYYLGGTTDGMADQIPANINGQQEAALSDGEFVMPADVVSHLGNGNSDAGAKVLYSMMDRVRQARTGTKEQGRKITPNKFTPV